ncbi:kinase activator [Lithospermum erythrorhizon]|uniref:Kinase activator n=1 Tax=Lithospermum erythrorhizon TaxID=34254 RepID=A0AAV3PPZ6_LITER
MVPSMDCVLSSLLCTEDASVVYDDSDSFECWNSNVNDEIVFEALSEECLDVMIDKEFEFLPEHDYLKRLKDGDLNVESRLKAISWIAKVHEHYNFRPLCTYLSVSYMDRFLSAYEIPKGKEWMIQLLAVACLSLAAKMEETVVPARLDLQVGERTFIFEAEIKKKMELLVLTTLKWRMHSVTPFSFIDNFVVKLNGDKRISRSLIDKSHKLVLRTLKVIDFLEFKPSEIAAAVTIFVIGEIQEMVENKGFAALFHHVRKDKVMQCVGLIEDMKTIDVLVSNGNCLAFQEDEDGKLGNGEWLSCIYEDSLVGSCANSTSEDGPIAKRRKMLNTPWEVEQY